MTEPGQERECAPRPRSSSSDPDYVDCAQIPQPGHRRVGFEGGMKIHAELGAKLPTKKCCVSHRPRRRTWPSRNVAADDRHGRLRRGAAGLWLLPLRHGDDPLSKQCQGRVIAINAWARRLDLGMAIVAMKVMGRMIFSYNSKEPGRRFLDPATARPAARRRDRWRFCRIPHSRRLRRRFDALGIHQNLATMTCNLAYTNEVPTPRCWPNFRPKPMARKPCRR